MVAPYHRFAHVALWRAPAGFGQVGVKVCAQAKCHRAQEQPVLQGQYAVVAALYDVVQMLADSAFGQIVPDVRTMVKDQISQRGQVLGTGTDDEQTGAIGLAHLRHACIQ